jgi:hypothetical protein
MMIIKENAINYGVSKLNAWSKEWILQQIVLEQLGSHMQNNDVGLVSHARYKN